jgi:Dephospho-CoA kinase
LVEQNRIANVQTTPLRNSILHTQSSKRGRCAIINEEEQPNSITMLSNGTSAVVLHCRTLCLEEWWYPILDWPAKLFGQTSSALQAPSTKPYVLGLTGSIAMGKSTVAGMFRDLQVPVMDSDAAVHEMYAQGGAAVPVVQCLFPDAIRDGVRFPEADFCVLAFNLRPDAVMLS